MKEVDEYTMNRTEKAEFIYCNVGPMMIHNYLCAACKTNSAVQNCNEGYLMPCWECQSAGYRLFKFKSGSFLYWLFRKVFE